MGKQGREPHGINIDSGVQAADSYPIGGKRQEYETDEAALSNAKVEEKWSWTSTSTYASMPWYLLRKS